MRKNNSPTGVGAAPPGAEEDQTHGFLEVDSAGDQAEGEIPEWEDGEERRGGLHTRDTERGRRGTFDSGVHTPTGSGEHRDGATMGVEQRPAAKQRWV